MFNNNKSYEIGYEDTIIRTVPSYTYTGIPIILSITRMNTGIGLLLPDCHTERILAVYRNDYYRDMRVRRRFFPTFFFSFFFEYLSLQKTLMNGH